MTCCASMRSKIVPDHLTVLHYEPYAFQLGNVSDGISSNGNQISKLTCFNTPHSVLPAQHFCGVSGDRTKYVEWRHSCVMQGREHGCRSFATRFSGVVPAHV